MVVDVLVVRDERVGDLSQLSDLHQKAAPGVFGVLGLAVEPDGSARFPEGGGDQVAAGQDIVR
ncbi:hypothetical protein AB0E62_12945 [Streptomyces sp. NPDC038707]|uniref:hypothetical protein n=1 Tax=unclassified Streptomyces TaxID=2593676 RepID=UPI0033E0DA28